MPFVDKCLKSDLAAVTKEMHVWWDWVGSSLLHTEAKAGAVSGIALSLAFAHACVCPWAPTSSPRKEGWVEHLQAGSRQSHQAVWTRVPLLQVVRSRAVNPISAPGPVSTFPSRLASPFSHPGFPPWSISALPWGSEEPLTVFSLITSDVWLATLFARLCLYSVPGWPRPLGDKKNVCLWIKRSENIVKMYSCDPLM